MLAKCQNEEHVPVPEGHHFAAPEVEEWKPHPYEGEGLHRRESLKVRIAMPTLLTQFNLSNLM